MKTIFIFNDNCPTDPALRFTALGEDGKRVATIVFDPLTVPHFGFAFALEHVLPGELHPGTAEPLRATRVGLLAAYDHIYGAMNWMPLWLSSPTTNTAWCDAMDVYRSRGDARAPDKVQFSDPALIRLLGAIASGSPSAGSRTLH